jgi:hypothetical protein
LFVLIIAIVGIYGLFYAAVTTVLMPMDAGAFKAELNTLEVPVNNASSIAELETAAADMEKTSSLSYISQEERSKVANSMKIGNTIPMVFINQNMVEYDKSYSNRIWAYDLVLRGDISRQIKNITSTHEEISRLNNETETINQKLYTDFEKGDSKAYADDLRKMANNLRQYNIAMEKLKTQLQKAVNQLEQ